MEPIISPWLVYVIGITGGLKTSLTVAAILCLVTSLISLLIHAEMEDEYGNKEAPLCDGPPKWRFIRKIVATSIALVLIHSFMPSRETVIGMVVANHVTVDNIKQAGDVVSEARQTMKQDVLDVILAIDKEMGDE